MKREVINKIIKEYDEIVSNRDLFKEFNDKYIDMDNYSYFDESVKSFVKFANKKDSDLLDIIYENNYELFDDYKPVYVYLASYQKTENELFPDYLLPHDNKYVDYSQYGILIGKPQIIYIPIEKREEFENNNSMLYLNDNEPFSKYYELRRDWLKSEMGQKYWTKTKR